MSQDHTVHVPASPAKMPAAYCCAPALSASNLRARTATYLGSRMVSSTDSATCRPSRGFKSAMKEEEKPADTRTIIAGDQS